MHPGTAMNVDDGVMSQVKGLGTLEQNCLFPLIIYQPHPFFHIGISESEARATAEDG